MVLVRGIHSVDSEIRVSASDCVAIEGSIDPSLAVLVPSLAITLAFWNTLQLELGDAAVWTGGRSMSSLVGQAALWRGACPAIEIGPSTTERDATGVDTIDWTDAEAASARLAELVGRRPGFAAVDLSGRADVIDLLLEVIPRWGRLLLAGPPGPPVTIDFYRNVHRKGIVIASTTADSSRVFDARAGRDIRDQLPKAVQILRNEAMAAQCERLLGVIVRPAPVSVAG